MSKHAIGWLMALAATVAYSVNAPIAKAAISAGMEPITLVAAAFRQQNV